MFRKKKRTYSKVSTVTLNDIFTSTVNTLLPSHNTQNHTWAAPKIWVGHLSEKCLRQVKIAQKGLKNTFLSKFCRGI